jgi:hypothetical protein
MVNLDELQRRARRTAELGRVRMAVRVGIVVLPLAALSLVGGAAPLTCGCMAGLLFLLASGLRFWHREGVLAVEMGLAMGSVPLMATAVLQSCGVACFSCVQLTGAEWACIAAGVLGGMGLAARATRAGHGPRLWGLALLVAASTAAMGCLALGLGGLVVTVGALVASSAAAWVPLHGRFA